MNTHTYVKDRARIEACLKEINSLIFDWTVHEATKETADSIKRLGEEIADIIEEGQHYA